MNFEDAMQKYKHIGHIHNGGWIDKETDEKASRVLLRSAMERYVAEEGRRIVDAHSNYDSGFEAGVLAAEAGLGRYDG